MCINKLFYQFALRLTRKMYFWLQHITIVSGNGDNGIGTRHSHVHGTQQQQHNLQQQQQHQQQQHHQQQQLLVSSVPSPRIIIGCHNVTGCVTDNKPDAGSPLLSISEVTNTLLNQ